MIILAFNQFRPIIIERNQISFESTYLAANKHPPNSATDCSSASVQFQVRQHGVSLSDEKKLVSHVHCVFLSEQLVSEESLHLRNERAVSSSLFMFIVLRSL